MESSEDENKHEYIPLLLKEKEIDSFKYADDDDEGTELKGEKNADDSVEETEMKQKKPPDEGTELKEKKTADDSIARTDENEAKTEQSTTHKVTPMQSGESQTDTEIYRTILKQMDKMYTDYMDVDFPDKERLLLEQTYFELYVNPILLLSLEDICEMCDETNYRYHFLHYFVIGRSMKLLSSILEKSLTGVDNKDDEGRSALHIAALLNYSDIATELINKHADINLADENGMTPLLFAANYGSLEVFGILLQNPATIVNVTDRNGKSVLHLAMKSNNTNILKILKKHKELMKTTRHVEWETLINMVCSEGKSALHYAVLHNNKESVEILLQEHANINLADKVGMTPLLLAANYGSFEVFEILLQNPATTVNVTAKNKNSVLHLAMKNNNTNILKILKKHKELMKRTRHVEWETLIKMDCSEGKSALHYAVLQNNKESVEILLQEQVCVNQEDIDDRTPLSYAAENGLVEITKILLEHDARSDADENGMMPIHYAAKNGHPEVVQFLVNKEYAWWTTNDGRNCLDIAIDEKHEETALVIIKSENWKMFLQNTTISETDECQTPMRKLIALMPDVAREVFNRCTNFEGTGDEFRVMFDYVFLDDTLLLDGWNPRVNSSDSDITMNLPNNEDTSDIKRNHPLMIMVTKKRTELYDHPLVSALLKKKWTGIGLIFYLLNVFLYVLYLAMLSGFALSVKAPYEFTDVSTDVTQDRIPPFAAFAKYSVIVLTAIELIIEICEMTLIFSCNMWSYIMEKENVLQWIAYILSILFVIHPSGSTDTGYRPEWQWSCGTVSVFLAWINLLLLTQKFDWIGIYVVMLFRVGKVFMKFFLVFSFLIVAFAITFHCLLQNQEPFSTFWISLVKTTEMMIGELDYTTIFFDEKVHYNAISHVFFYIFMLFMTIVVVNLMVGLAVDNIREFQTKAGLAKKEMQVRFALELERLSTSGIFQKCVRRVQGDQNENGGEVRSSQSRTGSIEIPLETTREVRSSQSLTRSIKQTSETTNVQKGQMTEILQPNKQNWLQKKIGKSWNLTEKDIRQALTSRTDGLSKEIKTLKREMKHMDAESRNEVRTINRDMQEEMKSMESRLQEKMKNLDAKLMTIIQNLKQAEDKSSTDYQQTVKL